MALFKVGDNAVYPGYGVVKITGVEKKEFFGTEEIFYTVNVEESGAKVMVPQKRVDVVGLRHIINKNEASEVLNILKEKDSKIDNQTWNRRYREYMEKIKTGSVFEIAEVLRDLFVLKVDKDLSFGERKMLDTARGLLLKELKLAADEESLNSQEVAAIFGLDEASKKPATIQ